MKHEKQYDIIIIGGSYAGLAAGMALGRALRKILIIDNGNPCNKQAPHSHNFLTNDGKTPEEITRIAREQVSKYNTVEFLKALATSGKRVANSFEIEVETGAAFTSKKLILATGIKDVMPDMPGFAQSWGISVLHCPYCHGYEVRQQKTGVLANGDTAFEMSSLISNWTNDLTLYTNGRSTLTTHQADKLKQHNMNIMETEIEQLEHNAGYIENITFRNGNKADVKALYTRLPFVQHSSVPGMLGCEFTDEGYIKTDNAQRTSVYGVFACGDNTTRLRTVANAISTGTITGMMVNKELIDESF